MKVVAALSGGVDSSAAAALAQQQGHEVIGVTLRLKHPDPDFSRAQLCAGKIAFLVCEYRVAGV
jgi:tRNA-specific 2-thiouridylase